MTSSSLPSNVQNKQIGQAKKKRFNWIRNKIQNWIGPTSPSPVPDIELLAAAVIKCDTLLEYYSSSDKLTEQTKEKEADNQLSFTSRQKEIKEALAHLIEQQREASIEDYLFAMYLSKYPKMGKIFLDTTKEYPTENEGSSSPEPEITELKIEQKLLNLMQQESCLIKYLELANSDSMLALAYAKADIAKVKEMREFGWLPTWERLQIAGKSLIIPVFLIALTAVLGNFVGNSLQESAFRRNRAYEHKLTVARKAHEDAQQWFEKVKSLYYEIGAKEFDLRDQINNTQDLLNSGSLPVSDRQGYKIKLDWLKKPNLASQLNQLRDLEKGIDNITGMMNGMEHNQKIIDAAEVAKTALGKYIRCLDKEKFDPKELCSEGDVLVPYKNLVDLFAEANRELVK